MAKHHASKRAYNLIQIPLLYISIIAINLAIVHWIGLSEADGLSTYGIDVPARSQSFLTFLSNTLKLTPGQSYFHADPVFSLALNAFYTSLTLAAGCFTLLTLSAFIIGIVSHFYQLHMINYTLQAISALPSVLIISLATYLLNTYEIFLHNPQQVWIPILMVSIKSLGIYVDLIKNSLEQQYQKNYAQFLRHLGINEYQLLRHYTLKCALIIIIPKLPLKFLQLLFSVLIFEALLGIKGFGGLMVHAVLNHDAPLISACMVIYGIMSTIGIMASELLSQSIYEQHTSPQIS